MKIIHRNSKSNESQILSRQSAGHAVAKFLAKHIKDSDKLGIAWGRCMQSAVDELSTLEPFLKKLTFAIDKWESTGIVEYLNTHSAGAGEVQDHALEQENNP